MLESPPGRACPMHRQACAEGSDFQEELRLAILRGLRGQLLADGRMISNEVGVMQEENLLESACGYGPWVGFQPPAGKPKKDIVCRFDTRRPCTQADESGPCRDQNREVLKAAWSNDRFTDDLTGLPLPPNLCEIARKKELDYFKSKGVWE